MDRRDKLIARKRLLEIVFKPQPQSSDGQGFRPLTGHENNREPPIPVSDLRYDLERTRPITPRRFQYQKSRVMGFEAFKDRGVTGRLQDLGAVNEQRPFYLLVQVVVLYGEQDSWPVHGPLLPPLALPGRILIDRRLQFCEILPF